MAKLHQSVLMMAAFTSRPGESAAPSVDSTTNSDRATITGENNDPYPLDSFALDCLLIGDDEREGNLASEIGGIPYAPSVDEGDANVPPPDANDMRRVQPIRSVASLRNVQPVEGPQAVTPERTVPRKKSRKRKSHHTTSREPDVYEYVDKPTNLDVLLGRGGKSNHHPGNKRYRREVTRRQGLYTHASKVEKTEISNSIVATIHGYGGRFIKKTETGNRWYVVPPIVARRKTSQALREI